VRAASIAALALALAGPGCASPCARTRASRAAFEDREPGEKTPRPHLSIEVPFALVERLVAGHLGALPAARLEMPEIAGVSTGTLALRVESVRLRPAPPGRLGFLVHVALRSGRTTVLAFDVEAVVRPRVDVARGEVVLALRGEDIQSIRPRLDAGARKGVVDFVWSQLPDVARMVGSKDQIAGLLGDAVEELGDQAFALVRRELLDELGEITRTAIDLPDLPLRALTVHSAAGVLTIDAHTALPVAEGVADAGSGRRSARSAHVRVSGAAAAELANWAMREGALPDRFDDDGEPTPGGPIAAGLAWRGDARRPLIVHLWRLEGDCAHVRLSATPELTVRGDELELRTDDANIEQIEGSSRVRAALWFSGLARRSLSFVETTTTRLDLDVAGTDARARVTGAKRVGDELWFEVAIDGAPAPRRN
jgi:hypothetical protein